jgi:beta-fructofuranosidase
VFDIPGSWVWDFWFADDGDRYHLFFLHAPVTPEGPDARHYQASVGHAVSDDLVNWVRVADALAASDRGAFDDVATWTGSVVRDADGTWFMFYTGAQRAGAKNVQRIGYATSHDLMTWHKSALNPVLEADPQWYEKLEDHAWQDEAFRDPWVFADPQGDGWHMLITARAREGDPFTRGVVGHARSADLRNWDLAPPLSAPTPMGFGQLEVMQVEEVDGRPVLLFSCGAEQASESRRKAPMGGAIWVAPADSITGPYDIEHAYPLADHTLYVGRLLRRRDDGRWQFFAFHNVDADGSFSGGVSDPMDVGWNGDRLEIREPAADRATRLR